MTFLGGVALWTFGLEGVASAADFGVLGSSGLGVADLEGFFGVGVVRFDLTDFGLCLGGVVSIVVFLPELDINCRLFEVGAD